MFSAVKSSPPGQKEGHIMKIALYISRLCIAILAPVALVSLNISCSTPSTPVVNRPPQIQQLSIFPEWLPLTEGQFSVTAFDPDGDNLTYTWVVDNTTITGNGATASWIAPAVMGKYNITVVVSDGKGHEVRGSREVKVHDGSVIPDAPVVLKMSLPSTDAATGSKRIRIWTAAVIECVVNEANAKDLKFTGTSSNGKLQANGLNEGTASKVTWIAPGAAGDYTVDVVVTDNRGNQARGTVNIEVFCCGN